VNGSFFRRIRRERFVKIHPGGEDIPCRFDQNTADGTILP
jgi:hypothetical protein